MRSLREVVFMANPLLEDADEETNRQIMIARLLKLNLFNRSTVSETIYSGLLFVAEWNHT